MRGAHFRVRGHFAPRVSRGGAVEDHVEEAPPWARPRDRRQRRGLTGAGKRLHLDRGTNRRVGNRAADLALFGSQVKL